MTAQSEEVPSVIQLSPGEIKVLLDRGELELFDVRLEEERLVASVAGARPMDVPALLALDRSQPVAFLCHHGVRSLSAAKLALKQGFRMVYNVKGGIEAWSLEVDSSIQRY